MEFGILTKLNGVNVGILITSSYIDSVGFFRGGNFYCSRRKSPRCSLGGGDLPPSHPPRLISDYLAGKKKSQNKNFDDHITTI
jgi:hypothetical protein